MTHPRKRTPNTRLFEVTLGGGRRVSLEQYGRLLDAYEADHPGFAPPRAGIRGNIARLGTPGLPPDWETPYLGLLDEPPAATEPDA